MELVVRADVPEVAREAADRVVTHAARAIAERGRFTFALAGGSTPAALYELLASAEVAPRVDWPRTLIFFGDERCVPPDHQWSNSGMARRSLLSRVPLPPGNIYAIAAENGPDNAALEYTATLGRVFQTGAGQIPRFDLILLGMGDDGHTASLFPGMASQTELEAWVVGTDVPQYAKPQVPRVTLTFPVLNEARAVLFLVTGKAKAAPARRAIHEVSERSATTAGSPEPLPAARVRPRDGLLTWLLDAAAASLLEG